MSKQTDKHIEKLIDKAMKEITLESPSIDFTNNIMSEVTQLGQITATTYQPLISKKIWFVIFSIVIGIIAYVISIGNSKQLHWFDAINFSSEGLLPNISFSNTAFYALIIVASLIVTQLILLKNYFNKRLEL